MMRAKEMTPRTSGATRRPLTRIQPMLSETAAATRTTQRTTKTIDGRLAARHHADPTLRLTAASSCSFRPAADLGDLDVPGQAEGLQHADANPVDVELVPGQAVARRRRVGVVVVVPALAERQQRHPPVVASNRRASRSGASPTGASPSSPATWRAGRRWCGRRCPTARTACRRTPAGRGRATRLRHPVPRGSARRGTDPCRDPARSASRIAVSWCMRLAEQDPAHVRPQARRRAACAGRLRDRSAGGGCDASRPRRSGRPRARACRTTVRKYSISFGVL